MFTYGKPATHCPLQYPLRDLVFPKMCTRNIYLDPDEKNLVACKIYISTFLLSINLIQFLL